MTRIIYKYLVEDMDGRLTIPKGSTYLNFEKQGNNYFIWLMINPDERDEVQIEYQLIYTGQQFDLEKLIYRGTSATGPLVFHLFTEPF